jgi:uncharacterized DUF497 family protein
MSVLFTWNAAKAVANAANHGVSFEEAVTVLFDPLELTDSDPVEPDRSISVGTSDRGRVLVVVYLERSDTIRIISAREATRRERRAYEEGP